MRMVLRRDTFTDKSTTGKLYVDGAFACYTLEDRVREQKVAGRTAIPAGRYTVTVSRSPRFGVDMPLLMHVPHFTGVRIHPGNHAGDTAGCILVGQTRLADFIGHSRAAYTALFDRIRAALERKEAVTIEVVVEPPKVGEMVVTKLLDVASTNLARAWLTSPDKTSKTP